MKQEIHPRPSERSPYKLRKYWCPYCACWCRAVMRRGYKRLDCKCEVSLQDWQVKKENGLW